MFLTYRSLAVRNFQGRGSRELQGRASAVPSRRAGWFTPKIWPLTREESWLKFFLECSNTTWVWEKTVSNLIQQKGNWKAGWKAVWTAQFLKGNAFESQVLFLALNKACCEDRKLCTSWPLLPNMERAQQAMHHSWLGLLGFLFVNGDLHMFCLFQQCWYSNYISHF